MKNGEEMLVKLSFGCSQGDFFKKHKLYRIAQRDLQIIKLLNVA